MQIICRALQRPYQFWLAASRRSFSSTSTRPSSSLSVPFWSWRAYTSIQNIRRAPNRPPILLPSPPIRHYPPKSRSTDNLWKSIRNSFSTQPRIALPLSFLSPFSDITLLQAFYIVCFLSAELSIYRCLREIAFF